MSDLTNAAEAGLLDHLFGLGTFTVVTPIIVALMTANGDDSTPGTEVSGGSYVRQSGSFARSGSTVSNDAEIVFTGMPAGTVVGMELYDSTGTPQRLAWGALTASKTVEAGDDAKFDVGELDLTMG